MTLEDARNMIALDSGDGDEWGHTLSHHFAIAAVLTHAGEHVPSEWEYRPSPMGVEGELSEYPDSEWLDMYQSGYVSADDMRTIGDELAETAVRLRSEGKDY